MVTSELPRPPLAEPHEVGGPERYDSYRGTSSERARARGTARFRSLGAREKWGYGVWLFAGLVFGVPESWAGIANPPWPALSDTIAHLESLWAPTAVIVVAPLVFIAFPVIRYALVHQGCATRRDLPGRQPTGPGRLSGPGPAAIGRASALAYLPAGLQASPLWQLHAASEQPRLSSQKWVI